MLCLLYVLDRKSFLMHSRYSLSALSHAYFHRDANICYAKPLHQISPTGSREFMPMGSSCNRHQSPPAALARWWLRCLVDRIFWPLRRRKARRSTPSTKATQPPPYKAAGGRHSGAGNSVSRAGGQGSDGA